jgi:hypothetical protein
MVGFDPATANGVAQISFFAKSTRLVSVRLDSVRGWAGAMRLEKRRAGARRTNVGIGMA